MTPAAVARGCALDDTLAGSGGTTLSSFSVAADGDGACVVGVLGAGRGIRVLNPAASEFPSRRELIAACVRASERTTSAVVRSRGATTDGCGRVSEEGKVVKLLVLRQAVFRQLAI